MHLIRMQKERQRKTAENRFLKIHHIIGGTYNDNGNKNRFYHHADREHYRTVWVLSSWGKSRKRYKRAIGTNAFFFFGAFAIASIMLLGGPNVQAAEAVTADAGFATGMGYLAAAIVTGLSCIGGGIAVASAASAALGAISEDSSVLGKSLIFVGLAEGVCLYGLIISFMILGNL